MSKYSTETRQQVRVFGINFFLILPARFSQGHQGKQQTRNQMGSCKTIQEEWEKKGLRTYWRITQSLCWSSSVLCFGLLYSYFIPRTRSQGFSAFHRAVRDLRCCGSRPLTLLAAGIWDLSAEPRAGSQHARHGDICSIAMWAANGYGTGKNLEELWVYWILRTGKGWQAM